MGSLFNIAAVFGLVKLNSFTFAALKNKCAGAVIIMFLLCWMNATFSYIAFYIHFDAHLTGCRLHRHHGDGCQAKLHTEGNGIRTGAFRTGYCADLCFSCFSFSKKTLVSPCAANRNFGGKSRFSLPKALLSSYNWHLPASPLNFNRIQ